MSLESISVGKKAERKQSRSQGSIKNASNWKEHFSGINMATLFLKVKAVRKKFQIIQVNSFTFQICIARKAKGGEINCLSYWPLSNTFIIPKSHLCLITHLLEIFSSTWTICLDLFNGNSRLTMLPFDKRQWRAVVQSGGQTAGHWCWPEFFSHVQVWGHQGPAVLYCTLWPPASLCQVAEGTLRLAETSSA